VVEARGVTFGLAYANNILNASKSGYGLTDADTAIIVCLRHNATIMAFDDTIWAPNGKVLADSAAYVNPRNADTPTANPSMRTIDALAKRGVHYAVCGLSAQRLAGLIAAGNGKTDEILKDLNAHLVPNGHMAPAGVIATTRAQEYGFSLISVA
jgi:intracellular sulfur oxidation DsrE/DsrF family protein